MLSTNKTFRVFVSSTFSDFKAERDALQRLVFPKLRELCRLHGAHFQAIDLRWGVSDEAAHEQQTMNICLEEIARCQRATSRPNFVILLGDRYGWRPVPDEIPDRLFEKICNQLKERIGADELALLHERYDRDDNALPPVYWLKPRNGKHRDPKVWEQNEQVVLAIFQQACSSLSLDGAEILKLGSSATEQEIACGVFLREDTGKDVHAFFRTIRNLQPVRFQGCQEDDVSACLRLKRLKEELRRCLPEANIHEYLVDWTGEGVTADHIGAVADKNEGSALSAQSKVAQRKPQPNFCQDFYDSLAGIIRCELEPVEADLLDPEIKHHSDFLHSRADERLFTGRTEALEKIDAYLKAERPPRPPLAVCGASGSGKSTLMAGAGALAQREHPQAQVISRFIGVTPESTHGRALLESLCGQISNDYGMGRTIPTDYVELIQEFSVQLTKIPADKPLFLFLDALDRLSDVNNARSLNWLPIELGSNVRLIVSILSDSPGYAVLERQLAKDDLLQLSNMPSDQGSDLLGRTEVLEKIGAYLKAERPPLAVCGASGSGKSTLMARAGALAQGALAQREHPQAQVISRFIGVTPESTHGRALLESLCGQISRAYRMERTVPTDNLPHYVQLSQEFSDQLTKIPADNPLYLFLDALDRLSDVNNARSLNWLPIKLGSNVRLVVSMLSDSPGYAVLERQLAKDDLLQLSNMPSDEGGDLLSRLLSQAKRTLQPLQRAKVLEGFERAPLPLYLKLAFEEARRWRSGDGPRDLENHIPGLVQGLFERLSRPAKHGRSLVSASLGFLAAAKNGLTEDELTDVLSEDACVMEDFRRRFPKSPKTDRLPVVIWSRLFYDLENYLSERSADGTSLLAFFHQQFSEVVAKVYLDEATEIRRHSALAEYFLQQQLQFDSAGRLSLNLRKLSELPYQLRKARMPDELENTLCDLSFIEAKCTAGLIDDLLADYDAALESGILREDQQARLGDFARFLHAQSHLLAAHPALTFQQALNEPDSTAQARTAGDLAERETRPRFRWLNKPQTISPCVLTLFGHSDVVNSCDVSPDGKRIVSASSDKELKIWDVANGRDLLTLRGHSISVETCSFSPDGKSIISGARNGEIKLWDAVSGNELRSFPGHRDGVATCKFSLDGRRVVSSSGDNTLKIWNAETGSELHTLSGHAGEVYSCEFSPDDKLIVSGGGDGGLKLWDAATGEKLKPFDGHELPVMSCAFSRDGKSVFSASEDCTLKHWDAGTRELRKTYAGHEKPVWCLAVSKDGTRLASGSDDGSIRLWDIATGAELAKMTGHTDQIWGLAFFPDGTRIVSAAWDSTLKVWDLKTAEQAQAERNSQQMPVESTKGKAASLGRPISACSCSPDGAYYAAGLADGNVKLWDAATGSALGTFDLHREWILVCKFLPDGRWILSGAWDGSLKLFDTVEQREGPVLPGMKKILDCAFSRDGKLLVSCSPDRIQVWEKSDTGVLPRCAWRGEEEHPFQTCAMAPDGKWIIGGFQDGRLVIWDVALETSAGSFAGHSGLRYCDLSPDGIRLVSASSDGSLKIWDVATRGELKHLAAHKVQVDSCNFSPDGKRVVSSSWDHT